MCGIVLDRVTVELWDARRRLVPTQIGVTSSPVDPSFRFAVQFPVISSMSSFAKQETLLVQVGAVVGQLASAGSELSRIRTVMRPHIAIEEADLGEGRLPFRSMRRLVVGDE